MKKGFESRLVASGRGEAKEEEWKEVEEESGRNGRWSRREMYVDITLQFSQDFPASKESKSQLEKRRQHLRNSRELQSIPRSNSAHDCLFIWFVFFSVRFCLSRTKCLTIRALRLDLFSNLLLEP